MPKLIQYPGATFEEFKDDHHHIVALDPVEATSAMLQWLTGFILSRVIPFLNAEGLLNDLLQKYNLGTTKELVDWAVQETASNLKSAGFDLTSGITGDLQVAVSGSCDNPDAIEINVLQEDLNISVNEARATIAETFTISCSLNRVYTKKGNSHPVHCSSSKAYMAWWEEFTDWMERMEEYERRMAEWREALRLYIETNGESPFPTAPTDLPPPWKMGPPVPPGPAFRKVQTFYVYWEMTIKLLAVVGFSRTFVLQEGFTPIGGPCCQQKP